MKCRKGKIPNSNESVDKEIATKSLKDGFCGNFLYTFLHRALEL